MKISIIQSEIEEAILEYIKKQITIPSDKELTVNLFATRGSEGFLATILVEKKADAIENTPVVSVESPSDDSPIQVTEPEQPKKRGFFSNLGNE